MRKVEVSNSKNVKFENGDLVRSIDVNRQTTHLTYIDGEFIVDERTRKQRRSARHNVNSTDTNT